MARTFDALSTKLFRTLVRGWRLPLWILSVVTGSKSFIDNPVLGSGRLNRLGLHACRVKLAHAMAARRRRQLAPQLPAALREEFDANGFILVPNYLPSDKFEYLRRQLLSLEGECRSHLQGDTITSRLPIGPSLLTALPSLANMLASPKWQGVMSYVAGFRSRPLYYLQAISSGVVDGPPDPQQELHADTFHPSMKAWLFLTDVDEDGSPLTYVQGSHRLTPARLAWEREKSIDVLRSGDRLSQRGSLRISSSELSKLGLPEATRFSVPANTLVVIDTCGFHARGKSTKACNRVELWAYCRRSPFLPWTGLDLGSLPFLADRRAEALARALDWLDGLGLAKQHWLPSGPWREQARLDASLSLAATSSQEAA